MNISVGIIGLPNVGKSTLFNALTKKAVPAENYPFCTIDPAVGVVAVPDERLTQLSSFSKSAKTIPAPIEFVDIAGLVAGASQGAGLGNQFLSHIREVDAILHIVRIFEDKNITHISGDVNPKSDVEAINLELILADLQTVTKRIAGVAKDVKRRDKEAIKENSFLEKIQGILEAGKLLSQELNDGDDIRKAQRLNLLSVKPMLYVLNKKSGMTEVDTKGVIGMISKTRALFVEVDAGIEEELSTLPEKDKNVFREELGSKDDGINNLIKESYKLLDLITYFTTGQDETRAWTVKAGSTAPEAGAAIHTDFKNKFIRAEVIDYEDLLESGSYTNARERGFIRTEGRDYVVGDGDVIEFKI